MIEFIEANIAWFIIGLILFELYVFDIATTAERSRVATAMAAGRLIDDLKSEIEELKNRIDDIQNNNDDYY